MCGIVAYTGKKNAYPILIKGLQRLEYRGYDSAGVALLNDKINLYKCRGKVSDLINYIGDKDNNGTTGIGHTRWATHGEPNYENAHPHFSQNENLALIHNGIIENYNTLKKELIRRGYVFQSNTDTEVLVHLIEDIQKNEKVDLSEAVRRALKQVIGTYAIVIIFTLTPDTLICARKGSPLVIGIGENEYFVASDGAPLIEYTKNVIYLNDEEIATISLKEGLKIKTIHNIDKTPYIEQLELSLNQIEKGGFEHFMLKEIYEQTRSISDSMKGRLNVQKEIVSLGGIVEFEEKMLRAKRFIIIACGTSWHAGLVAEYIIEDLVRIPVEVEYASEFRYRNPIITEDDVVIAISQSGETADTLAAIDLAKQKGATVLGICNVVGSSIARATHAGSYTHAGPEIGVASTKAFTSQVTVLSLMALALGYKKGTISKSRYNQLITDLESIPAKVEETLNCDATTKKIAEVYKNSTNCLYLGRGINFPVALEGALKLKEISYIHAEGYPAAEMKHGPIALIDKDMPVVIIATQNSIYDKLVSNIQEVKARQGQIIAIVSKGDIAAKELSNFVIEIPETDELFVPLLATIPLQLLAYHIAVLRGCNVDMPRNLAKSVTVE